MASCNRATGPVRKVLTFCPSCKSDRVEYDGVKEYACTECGFALFHNTAAAVGVFIECCGKVLFIVRNREPQTGKLDLPGGFVDPGESAEQAAIRETREELGIEIADLRYFGSYPNTYDYKGVLYTTLDVFFISATDRIPGGFGSEVREVRALKAEQVRPDEIGFDSVRAAVAEYVRRFG